MKLCTVVEGGLRKWIRAVQNWKSAYIPRRGMYAGLWSNKQCLMTPMSIFRLLNKSQNKIPKKSSPNPPSAARNLVVRGPVPTDATDIHGPLSNAQELCSLKDYPPQGQKITAKNLNVLERFLFFVIFCWVFKISLTSRSIIILSIYFISRCCPIDSYKILN
jgi:hypothetical protein